MKLFYKKRGAEIRLIPVHPIFWAEVGARIHVSKEMCGVRIQLFRWEIMAYVQYALYDHQKPGHPSYEYWENLRRQNAEQNH